MHTKDEGVKFPLVLIVSLKMLIYSFIKQTNFPVPRYVILSFCAVSSSYSNYPGSMDMNTQQQPPQPYTQAPSPQLQQNNSIQQQNKPKHNNNQKFNSSDVGGGSKAPPVPTLVRQPGSNLVGLKPTHLPDEVVKVTYEKEIKVFPETSSLPYLYPHSVKM